MIASMSDGRVIEHVVTGPDDGRLLVFNNGTPCGPAVLRTVADAAADRGLRTLFYARPGYGDSTPQPGRSVADCVSDVAALVDSLGADQFVSMGWSGGGPHVLALSAGWRDRCAAVASIAGPAPPDADGLDFLAGMADANVEEFGLAFDGEAALVPFLEAAASAYLDVSGEQVAAALGGLVSDVDRAALAGNFVDDLAACLRSAVRHGMAGWRDDDLAFTTAWGVDLATTGPVSLWHGALDLMVPQAHGHWLAATLPRSRAHLLADEGHVSLVTSHIPDIVDDLLDLAGW